jgi:hypothetical protein
VSINQPGIPTGLGSSIMAPSGIRSGVASQGNNPISTSLGTQTNQTAPTYTLQNTQPGPPIYQWDIYDFMLNAYFGEGGFHDGSALVKSQVEKNVQYVERRANSYYKNYVKPIIDATYIPVFTKTVTRTTTVNGVEDAEGRLAPMWAAFQKDVDNRGTCISLFTQKIVRYARILGVSFIVMDNFSDAPQSEVDAIQSRKFPFVAMRLPQQVEIDLLKLDKFLGILEIVFREEPVDGVATWKKWTKEYSVLLQKDEEGKFFEVSQSRFDYNLGKVPVFAVFSAECEDGTILPKPNFYDIARCNWKLFNTCSAQDRLMRAQMFAILCAPRIEQGFASSPNQGFELPANDSNNGLSYPVPFYLAPPTGPYAEISKNINDLATDLFQMAGQSGVTGIKTEASGVSAAYSWQGQEWVLKQTSAMSKRAEESIAKLYQLYVQTVKIEYCADYATDFQVVDKAAKYNQFSKFLQDNSQLSTPYTPVIAEGVKEYCYATFEGLQDAAMKKIIDWVDGNTNYEEAPIVPEIEDPIKEEEDEEDKEDLEESGKDKKPEEVEKEQ